MQEIIKEVKNYLFLSFLVILGFERQALSLLDSCCTT
jgi:hypothetical protein